MALSHSFRNVQDAGIRATQLSAMLPFSTWAQEAHGTSTFSCHGLGCRTAQVLSYAVGLRRRMALSVTATAQAVAAASVAQAKAGLHTVLMMGQSCSDRPVML